MITIILTIGVSYTCLPSKCAYVWPTQSTKSIWRLSSRC